MNKKILIGSIFAAFLLVSIPFIPAAQEQQKNKAGYATTQSKSITLSQLINNLQYIHDYIAENYPEEFDQEFLAEFQENINALSNTGAPAFCASLLACYVSLAVIYNVIINFAIPPPGLLVLVSLSLFTVLVIAQASGCPWAFNSYSSEALSCGCTQ